MSNAEKSVMPENVPQRKIMVLATNGFVLSHWAYTNFIAQVAQNTGYEVMVVTCKGAFESCISKRSMVLEANSSYKQRLEICKRCRGNQEASLRETGFDHVDFSELMSIELYSMVSRLVDSCEDPQTLKRSWASSIANTLEGFPRISINRSRGFGPSGGKPLVGKKIEFRHRSR